MSKAIDAAGRERSTFDDEPVGPFPQEPAFGSPEAVAQAAETIRGLNYSRTDLLAEVERLRGEVQHWRGEAEMYKGCRASLAELNPRLDTMRQQRDALADALLFLLARSEDWTRDRLDWHFEKVPAVIQAREALRKAGR